MSDKLKTDLVQIDQYEQTALEVSGLTKSFGRIRVLDGLNLSIDLGEVVSILGSNGSGKTTLINIISMLTNPDYGSIRVFGRSIEKNPNEIRSCIGMIGHSPMLYSEMTGLENLTFFGRMFRIDDLHSHILKTADSLGISNILDRKVGSMSHGMQKRFAIARAILHKPRILLMDEPESGLDQSAIDLLRNVIGEYKSFGCAILLVTHSLDEAVKLGDRVSILSRGKVAYEQSTASVKIQELRKRYFQYSDQYTSVEI